MINNVAERIIFNENCVFIFTSANTQAHQEASQTAMFERCKTHSSSYKREVEFPSNKNETIVQFSRHRGSAATALFGLARAEAQVG